MSQKVKFYTDEHVPLAIAKGLRLRGAHVLTAQEAQTLGFTDEEHLAFAEKEKRVLITFDADFLRLHAKGIPHAGIAFVSSKEKIIGEIIRGLLLIFEMLDASEIKNKIEFL